MISLLIRIQISVRIGVRSRQLDDDASGEQIHIGHGSGEVQVLAAEKDRRAGRPHVDLPCSALEQISGRVFQLCAADDGVIDQQDALVFDEFTDRNQLHFSDEIAYALIRRHKGTRPGRRIFDKRTGERNAGFIGISDRMGGTGIGNTRDDVRVLQCTADPVALGKRDTAAVTRFFHV